MAPSRTALVTGSTSGIGLAIARALAANGCDVVFNGFGDEDVVSRLVQETADSFRVRTLHVAADLSRPAEVRSLVAAAEAQFGAVDILVNNAGIQFTAPIEDFPDEKWDEILAVNLSAAFHAIKAALPGMRRRNYGRIVNIASVHGLVASVNKSAYVAAKHGLVGLTKAAALEAAEADITVNAVCPGWVRTQMPEKQIAARAADAGVSIEEAAVRLVGEKHPNKRFLRPESVAALVTFLCGEHASGMTGEILTIDGGWTAQ
jgi:3-hydroxybutyrate dehydrogenase